MGRPRGGQNRCGGCGDLGHNRATCRNTHLKPAARYSQARKMARQVVVASRFNPVDVSFNLLAFANGSVRVYDKDRLDPRITGEAFGGDADPPPVLESFQAIRQHFDEVAPNAHRPCLIPMTLARKLFANERFAEIG